MLEDSKSHEWPVDPRQFPLHGRMKGHVYIPPAPLRTPPRRFSPRAQGLFAITGIAAALWLATYFVVMVIRYWR